MIPKYYEFHNPVRILSGNKALESVPFELDRLGAQRPIVVTDKGIVKAGLVDVFIKSFSGSNMTIGVVFDETPIDSSNVVVTEIASICREKDCDSIIAIGGGSVIDTAKGVNIVVTEESDDLLAFMGNNRLTRPLKPLVVVPTTAGTGSEATPAAVIANPDKNVKMQFISPFITPNVAVLDPRMTLTMPAKITAATGMDALTHAIEAYIGPQKNPLSDAYAFAAMELIRDYLIVSVKRGSDVKARLALANAALLAGISFSNSMVGIVHAAAHAVGGISHVPHGVANAVLLPFGMEYNMGKCKEQIAGTLLPLVGLEAYAATPAQGRADEAVAAVRRLTGSLHEICGLPVTLSEAGVTEDKLEEIAKGTINDGAISYSSEHVGFEEALALLKAAF
ncbi:MAG: iron-containing alcohol dehydrogenase [Proteobacteria bacterium]|nr:iron-containing alcohol dehydrogenase [Pseudomonadota bacterium]